MTIQGPAAGAREVTTAGQRPQMAKLMGISGPGVINFEQRTHQAIRLETLARYLTALGYTMTGFCLRGPGQPGLVHGSCGHPVDRDEYEHGWHGCAPCSTQMEAARVSA